MKEKHIRAYMEAAFVFSRLSHSRRLQVGAVIVKDDRIPSYGYNGTPPGWDEKCEYEVYAETECPDVEEFPHVDDDGRRYKLVTKPEVMHAEFNAIGKLAGSNESSKDAIIFVTNQPCFECAKLIHRAGIKEVYYAEPYRLKDGIEHLEKAGIKVTHVDMSDKTSS
jgi:dCMP deaminase